MPNLELTPKEKLSSFRRIAIGTWKTTNDPSVYGALRLQMDKALDYRDRFRAATGRKLTLTHMLAKAMAGVMQVMPDANAVLRFNRIYLRKRIGVFFQVALEDPETGEIDLSGAVIHDPEQKTLLEICDEFQTTVEKVRTGKDENLEETRSTFKKIPFIIIKEYDEPLLVWEGNIMFEPTVTLEELQTHVNNYK